MGQFDELLDLGESEDDGELPFQFGKLDLRHGARGVAVAIDEELVEGPQGGEMETDGGAREFALHAVEEIGAKVVSGEVSPGGEAVRHPGAEGNQGVLVVCEGARGDVLLYREEFVKLFGEGVGL